MRRQAMMAAALILLGAAPLEQFDWAFPGRGGATRPDQWDTRVPLSVPGSTVRFVEAQLHDMHNPPDWRPDSHPAAPRLVTHGQGDAVNACGFCHLPGGEGRAENASLAGLRVDYLEHQVAAFAAGTRRSASPDWVPSAMMAATAHGADPAAVHAAALYFHGLRYRSHIRVVEATTVPHVVARAFILQPVAGSPQEPIGARIVETPDDFERFERRDPDVTYTAFVPPGSLARGAAVTRRIGCPACHGAGIKLWGAGRSPSYIVRQLLAFQSGARHDPASGPMRAVARRLTPEDMIAVAAYWGSLEP